MDLLMRRPPQSRRWLARLVLLSLWVPLAHPQTGSEYEVKAAFLYKFASFVEWPDADPGRSLTICVAGRDPFGAALDRIVKGKTVNGRTFLIRRLKSVDPASGCQILFIAASERRRLKSILEGLQSEPVLTVGDVPEFCESGGVVNLAVSENRVQLEIRPGAAERAGLELSSRLLSLARIFHDVAASSR